jgi:hypothetical protein
MDNQEVKKKPFYKKWWVWVLAVFALFIIIGEIGSPSEQAGDTQPQLQLLAYKIIEQEDVSYLNCKRVGIRVTVPDDAQKGDVNFTLDKIIDDNKSKWDDITVWAYKNSEETQVGTIGHTKGVREYSICN